MKVWKKSVVDVNQDMKENVVVLDAKYRVVTPYFDSSCEMKLCYEGLKEIIWVDVNQDMKENVVVLDISIGLLPLILIVSWNETVSM